MSGNMIGIIALENKELCYSLGLKTAVDDNGSNYVVSYLSDKSTNLIDFEDLADRYSQRNLKKYQVANLSVISEKKFKVLQILGNNS